MNIMKNPNEPKRVSCLLVDVLLIFGAGALQAASTIQLTSTSLHNQLHEYYWLAAPSDLAGGREVLRTVKTTPCGS